MTVGVAAAGVASGLDHIGIVVRDLPRAAAAWAACGFAPSGPGGRRIMLRRGYIELLADDPAQPSATLARLLAQGEGAHVLTLRVASAEAAAARLRNAGLPSQLTRTDRPADPARPDGPIARFLRLPLTDADPRLQLLEHLTPELVWREEWLTHPNGATALRTVTIATADPAAMAARLSRCAGLPVGPGPQGGYLLPMAQGSIHILPGPGAPRIIAIALDASTAHTGEVTGITLTLAP